MSHLWAHQLMLMRLHIKDINFLTFREGKKVLTGDCGVNDLCRAPTPLEAKTGVMSAENVTWAVNTALNVEISIQLTLFVILAVFPI